VYDLRADKRKSLTAKAVKRELTGEQSSDFFGYVQEYAENLNVKGEYWEWKKIRVMVNKLRDFASGETLYFKEIDHKFVARFERFMREEYGNVVNTIAKNLQILQRIMKSAAKEGIISTADDPFLHYQIKMEKTTKQKQCRGEPKSQKAGGDRRHQYQPVLPRQPPLLCRLHPPKGRGPVQHLEGPWTCLS